MKMKIATRNANESHRSVMYWRLLIRTRCRNCPKTIGLSRLDMKGLLKCMIAIMLSIMTIEMTKPRMVLRIQSMRRVTPHLVLNHLKKPMKARQMNSNKAIIKGGKETLKSYGTPNFSHSIDLRPDGVHPGSALNFSMHHCGVSRNGSTKMYVSKMNSLIFDR